jgi:hypothetical protein
MPAGVEAARLSGEYQARKTRSTKCWSDQEPVLRISGKAMTRI